MEQVEDGIVYKAVVNDEEQYSIWPADRPNPAGWHDAGKTGTKPECLDWIATVWVDMRPASLRRRMAETEGDASNGRSTSGAAPRPT
jgi:MbtH protein